MMDIVLKCQANQTSTTVTSHSMDQQTLPLSSHSNPMVQSTPPLSSRGAVEVSNESFTQTSTPAPSASMDQQALPRSSHSNLLVQHTPLSSREAVENPLVRAGLVPQHLYSSVVSGHIRTVHSAATQRQVFFVCSSCSKCFFPPL